VRQFDLMRNTLRDDDLPEISYKLDDGNKDKDEDECPQGMVFFSNGKGTCMKEGYCKAYPNDDQCKSDHNYNDNNKPNIIQKTTVINSASEPAMERSMDSLLCSLIRCWQLGKSLLKN